MQLKYFIRKQDDQLGPFSMDEVCEKLLEGVISIDDIFYDENTREWLPLKTHKQIHMAWKTLQASQTPDKK